MNNKYYIIIEFINLYFFYLKVMYKFDNCNENIEKSIFYELEIKFIK